MPYVTISASQSFSAEQKRQLVVSASDAVVSSLQSPVENVRVLLNEYPEAAYVIAGKNEIPMLTYQIDLIEGRDDTKKAALVNTLKAAGSAATGLARDDIKVRMSDFRREDMGHFPA